MNFKEYLKKYKEKMGVSNEYIASQLGVNRSTVTRWLKGDTKVTNPEVIEKLSFILGVDVESLINNEERFEKPVLGEVKAGYDLLIDENFEGYEQVTQDDYYRGDFFLRVVGDSMLQDNPATADSVGIRSGFSSGRTQFWLISGTG